MRNITLLAAAGCMVLATSAQAQDIADWSGFYAGVLAGYGLDRTQEESSSSIFPPTEVDEGLFYSGSSFSSQERIEGLVGGIGIGYNFQHDQFVLGLDGDVNFGQLDKTSASSTFIRMEDEDDFFALGQGNETTFGIDWYSTFALRAGVTFDGWLVYAKAGAAVGNVSSSSTSTISVDSNVGAAGPIPVPPGTYSSHAASSQLLFGPTFGIGAEKMLTPNISVGAEYSYVGLPDVSIPQPNALGGLFGGGAGDPIEVTSSIHVVKGSLKYHF